MSIIFNEKTNQFHLHTASTSYICEVFNGILAHAYWGKRVKQILPLEQLYKIKNINLAPHDLENSDWYSTDVLLHEFATWGSADLRTPAFHAVYADGSTVTRFRYKGHRILKGKPSLCGLPSTYVNSDDTCETLEIELFDDCKSVSAFLLYSVFEEKDIITRSVRIANGGKESMTLKTVESFCADFPNDNYDMISLYGAWARECHIQRAPLFNGIQAVDSKHGASGPNHNPFVALCSKDATETSGEVFGLALMYSGNFYAGAAVDRYSRTRLLLGLNSFNFEWNLGAGEEFQAPEVIMSYSSEGIGKMSRQFHKIIAKNVCRGKWRDIERPTLINNWEATYFDFNEEKLLNIADAATELGIDMLVLDDGWFGKRNTDNCSLGDWYENREKLPGGLKGLGEKLNQKGLKFGLWFEPEMVSPDSDLYRAHPDWCLHTANRPRTESRQQLVLDFSRQDVCDYIVKSVSDVLRENPIAYVKWDMNRHMSEAGSALLKAENQREVFHRYILGLYSVLERITTAFPEVLFESCSSGGGRFDAGMFYYMPQTWTSDDSDAVERLYIQEGTSLVYPFRTMGAHISAVPNHQVGRVTPLKLRGDVAMLGQFGFELDLSKMSVEDKELSKKLIAFYKEYGEIIHSGEVYKLASVFEGKSSAFQIISEDKNTVIVFLYNIQGKVGLPSKILKLQNLEANAEYVEITDEKDGTVYGGDALMNVGILQDITHDHASEIRVFKRK